MRYMINSKQAIRRASGYVKYALPHIYMYTCKAHTQTRSGNIIYVYIYTRGGNRCCRTAVLRAYVRSYTRTCTYEWVLCVSERDLFRAARAALLIRRCRRVLDSAPPPPRASRLHGCACTSRLHVHTYTHTHTYIPITHAESPLIRPPVCATI